MPGDSLKEIAIQELLHSPAGEWLSKAMETAASVQRTLFAISESEDGSRLTLLKIGTVFQIFLIDALASGKKPEDLSEEDWKNISDKVSRYAVYEDGRSYTEFVFNLYADYIELSAKELRKRTASKENADRVRAIADEIRNKTKLMRSGKLSETEYTEQCLWLSLEAMIKCLSLSLTSLIGPESAQLAQAASQMAFEYGRYMLYAKEQAVLQAFIENQYVLDEKLQKEYDAYLEEVNRNAARFQALVDEAFSPGLRESLIQSIALAKAAGVKGEDLLKSTEEIDAFFM